MSEVERKIGYRGEFTSRPQTYLQKKKKPKKNYAIT
jgi:hypothetical protein